MIHFAILALGVVLGMGLLTWFSLPRSGKRIIAVGCFTALSIAAFAAVIEGAGQPKPVLLEWRNIFEAPIVGLAWDEDQQIVWAWMMEGNAPVAYALPWPKDKKKFGDLQDKWRRRGVTGDEFKYDAQGDVAKVVPPPPQPDKTQ